MVLNIFSTEKSENFSFKYAIFFKISVFFLFDLFTNKARKLKVAKSNHAKASLTKLWLTTDEANRSPVI